LYPIGAWVAIAAAGEVSGSGAICVVGDKWMGISLVLIPVVISMVSTAIILVPLVWIVIKTKSSAAVASKRKRWMSTVRVVIYITYYLIVTVLSNTVSTWNYVRQDDVSQGFIDWVTCSMSLGSDCRDKHLLRLNFPFYIFAACFIDIGGVVVFFCFGTSDEVWRFWKEILKGRISVVLESTTYTITTTGTSTPTHKSKTFKADDSNTNNPSAIEGENQQPDDAEANNP